MRPLVATIDLTAIRHNYAVAKRCAPGRQAFAVVKANAYGHGVREVVTALHEQADGFAVACLEEAAEVRALHGDGRILLLQGCFEASEYQFAAELGLMPAMTLSAQLLAIREVAVDDSIGYGAAWRAERPSRIGTVSCGYADGYPRHAPSGTPLLVRGQRVSLVGRVSMDMLTVDLSDLPGAQVGDGVELWGTQLPVDEVARAAGTIGYELLSKVTQRVPRRYRNV